MVVDIGPAADAAARTTEEKREPRPYTSRYPIPDDRFRKLKDSAVKTKVPKGLMTASADAGGGVEVSSTGVALAAMDPSLEPSAAPTASTNFSGIAATGWIPPDCTMAVGPSHVMLSVNSSVAVHNKVGGAVVLQRTLTQWFSNVVSDQTIFDPKLLYDQHAARWVLLAVAFRTNPNASVFLLSVSATANPLGQWRNYALDAMKDGTTSTGNWADFPALGVDAHALYLTANMFAFGGGFQYAKIRIVPKAGPYSGGPAPFFDLVKMQNPDNSMAFTVQPCHTFGAPQVEYLVNSRFPSGSALTLWRIANPTAAPILTRTSVATSAYTLPPNADQQGGLPPLNTGDVRVLEATFRGDSVWCALTTSRNWGLGNGHRSTGSRSAPPLPRWFRKASTGHGPLTISSRRLPRHEWQLRAGLQPCWHERVRFDRLHRPASDRPLGSLQASALLKAGVAHYQALDSSGRNRWGDYNGVSADLQARGSSGSTASSAVR